ncbi:hypothetical protein FZC66_20025 [Priestia megaterium]|nr:hypothetical protein FZC66_20025 [Priestia megaterium]
MEYKDLVNEIGEIWKSTLNLNEIMPSQSFFECGGDSLLAVRFLSKCAESNIPISAKQLYTAISLEDLINMIYKNIGQEGKSEDMVSVLEKGLRHQLLPTQERWVDGSIIDINHFNLGGLFYAPKGVTISILKKAIEIVLSRQEALRTSYKKSGNEWIAKVLPVDTAKVLMVAKHSSYDDRLEDIEKECTEAQQSMDLEKGIVFKMMYFPFERSIGRILIIGHHLTLDGFSINVLADEIEKAIKVVMSAEELNETPPLQPYHYSKAVEKWVKSKEAQEDARKWLSLPWDSITSIKPEKQGKGLLTSIKTLKNSFSSEETKLLASLADTYKIRLSELLLGAAAFAISKWSNQKVQGIDVYYHGRDESPNNIDISKTIAFILNTYPILLDYQEFTQSNWVEHIAKQIQSLPMNKYSFDALKYYDSSVKDKFFNVPKNKIRYNFRGHMKRIIQREECLLKPAPDVELFGRNRSPYQTEKYFLMLEGDIVEGSLSFGIKYSTDLFNEETIQSLINETMRLLIDVVKPKELVE